MLNTVRVCAPEPKDFQFAKFIFTTGYGSYFIIATLAVLPATALFLYLWPRFREADATSMTPG